MLPKLVFDKTEIVKIKISNKFKQNIDETDSKQPKSIGKSIPAYELLKISIKKSVNQKSRDFRQIYSFL